MKIPLYVSLTAREFSNFEKLPTHCAWMACHFSAEGNGLTNLPAYLPPGSVVIVNDREPAAKQDAKQVRQSLAQLVARWDCCGIVLDLQRKREERMLELIRELLSLPCPVYVSELYAKELRCPVFLSPIPMTVTPEEYLTPWQGREVWLDLARESTLITVTAAGTCETPWDKSVSLPLRDDALFCHYQTELSRDAIRFYLHRTKQDLTGLLAHCAAFGVRAGIGFWEELI